MAIYLFTAHAPAPLQEAPRAPFPVRKTHPTPRELVNYSVFFRDSVAMIQRT